MTIQDELRLLRQRRAIVAGFLATLLITYPGFLTWDSVNQLTEARNGSFSSLHPPVMAFLWSLVEHIITGPFGMLLIQIGAIWTGLYLVQQHYLEHDSRVRTLMPFLVVFFPPVFAIIGLITKDIQMTAFFILAVGIAVKVVHEKTLTGTTPRLLFAAFWGVLWLTLAQRHNAVGAAPGLIGFLLFSLYFTEKSLPARLLISLCTTLLATAVVFILAVSANKLLANTERHAWAQISAFDIAGTAAFTDDPDYVETLQLSSIASQFKSYPVTKEELVASYHPEEWTFIFHDGPFTDFWSNWPNADEAAAYAEIWKRLVATYPKAYLSHRLNVFKAALGLGEKQAPGVGFTDWTTFAGKQRAEALHVDATLSSLQKLAVLALKGFHRFTPLFRPYLYLLGTLVCLGIGAYLLKQRRPSLPFFLALSGLGSESTVLLAAPTFEYRYSYLMIVTTVLSIVLLWAYITQQRAEPAASYATDPKPDA